jgi:hypothetical protein
MPARIHLSSRRNYFQYTQISNVARIRSPILFKNPSQLNRGLLLNEAAVLYCNTTFHFCHRYTLVSGYNSVDPHQVL